MENVDSQPFALACLVSEYARQCPNLTLTMCYNIISIIVFERKFIKSKIISRISDNIFKMTSLIIFSRWHSRGFIKHFQTHTHTHTYVCSNTLFFFPKKSFKSFLLVLKIDIDFKIIRCDKSHIWIRALKSSNSCLEHLHNWWSLSPQIHKWYLFSLCKQIIIGLLKSASYQLNSEMLRIWTIISI